MVKRRVRILNKKAELEVFGPFNNLKSHHQKLFAILIGVALIMFWRGIWGLLDMYFLPSNLFMSYLFSVIIGITFLVSAHFLVKGLT